MEAQGDPLKDGLNAAKPLLTRFCVAKSVIHTLQTSLTHPELPPKTPAITRAKDCFAFVVAGVFGGSFWFGWEGWDLHLVMISPNDKKTETDRKPFEGSVGSLGIRSFFTGVVPVSVWGYTGSGQSLL